MPTCKETRAVQTHLIMYSQMNMHKTLYGGQLMHWLDETAGIAAARFARTSLVTASLDQLDFLQPLYEGHSVCLEAYVSGAGKRSMEVFVKVIGEDLLKSERYLAATSFLTFTSLDRRIELPDITPETAEEKYICAGYAARRASRKEKRTESIELAKHVNTELPW
ncbi:acyl-CoA thioesterase [Enterococcus sp. 669A]|uniref:Acyl-CoA thioesterase n=1 Tax=Candidatus Enterococcus moelleringii TaxID=2815325 RepID=A0ABS3LDN9_9ENTE|nr:acyl-CoA thioesterase [Enterococcus sp. 669A]MBO1307748.1 acyl-CoA thioesterase [Enterococcus sp. 669A]